MKHTRNFIIAWWMKLEIFRFTAHLQVNCIHHFCVLEGCEPLNFNCSSNSYTIFCPLCWNYNLLNFFHIYCLLFLSIYLFFLAIKARKLYWWTVKEKKKTLYKERTLPRRQRQKETAQIPNDITNLCKWKIGYCLYERTV